MSTQAYTAPDWSLVSGHTALILIDLQNDVLSDDGWYAKSGVDISHMQRVIEPTKRMLDGARAKGMPVIWTTHGLHNEIDAGVFWDTRPFLHGGGFRVGSWGHGIYDEYEVLPDEWIVDKRRLSAFFNTELRHDPEGARGRDPDHLGRTHESMRRRHHQGRDVPRLQGHHDRGLLRHDLTRAARADHQDVRSWLGCRVESRATARSLQEAARTLDPCCVIR